MFAIRDRCINVTVQCAPTCNILLLWSPILFILYRIEYVQHFCHAKLLLYFSRVYTHFRRHDSINFTEFFVFVMSSRAGAIVVPENRLTNQHEQSFRWQAYTVGVRGYLLTSLLCVLSSACATPGPDAISVLPVVDLSPAQVRADVSAHVSQRVRWGGSIAAVENRAEETWLEIVSRPLDSSGRPRSSDDSAGRFIAKVKGFLDPAVYAQGRLTTVAGVVAGGLTRTIGEYAYAYVVVDADTIKLWEQVAAQPYYYPNRFYDPFYDPFWRPYPWYAPYPFYSYWR